MRFVNAVVIYNVALTKKQNLLIIYLQMMRIKKCSCWLSSVFLSIDYGTTNSFKTHMFRNLKSCLFYSKPEWCYYGLTQIFSKLLVF